MKWWYRYRKTKSENKSWSSAEAVEEEKRSLAAEREEPPRPLPLPPLNQAMESLLSREAAVKQMEMRLASVSVKLVEQACGSTWPTPEMAAELRNGAKDRPACAAEQVLEAALLRLEAQVAVESGLVARITDLEASLTEVADQERNREHEAKVVVGLNTKVKQLEAEVTHLDSEVTRLSSELCDKTSRLDTTEVELQRQSSFQEKFEDQLAEAARECDVLKAVRVELEQQLVDTQQAAREHHSRNKEKYRAKLKDLKTRIAELMQEKEDLEEQKAKLEAALAKSEKNRAELKQQLLEGVAAGQLQNAQLAETLRLRVKSLEAELALAMEEREAAECSRDTFKQQVVKLEARVSAWNSVARTALGDCAAGP